MKRILMLGLSLVAVSMLTCSCISTAVPAGEGALFVAVKAKGEVAEGSNKAQVYIDGEQKGVVTVDSGKGLCLYCPNGNYIIKIESEGYQDYQKPVKVRGMNPGTWVNVTLKPVAVE